MTDEDTETEGEEEEEETDSCVTEDESGEPEGVTLESCTPQPPEPEEHWKYQSESQK